MWGFDIFVEIDARRRGFERDEMREVEGNGDRGIDKVSRVKRVECVLYGIAGGDEVLRRDKPAISGSRAV